MRGKFADVAEKLGALSGHVADETPGAEEYARTFLIDLISECSTVELTDFLNVFKSQAELLDAIERERAGRGKKQKATA